MKEEEERRKTGSGGGGEEGEEEEEEEEDMSARAETFNNHSSKMFTGAKTFVSRRDDKLGKHRKMSARANTMSQDIRHSSVRQAG